MTLSVNLVDPIHVVGEDLSTERSLSIVDVVLSISGLEGIEGILVAEAASESNSEQSEDNRLHTCLQILL